MILPNYPQPPHVSFGEVIGNVRTALLPILQAYDPTIQTIQYMYETMDGVRQRLIDQSQNMIAKNMQFPLVIWVFDAPLQRGTVNKLYGDLDNVRILILNHTKHTYNAEERENINFQRILRPIYYYILEYMSRSSAFSIQSSRAIAHTMVEHFYWGADDGTLNVISKYVDAIELTDMQVSLNWASCVQPINANLNT